MWTVPGFWEGKGAPFPPFGLRKMRESSTCKVLGGCTAASHCTRLTLCSGAPHTRNHYHYPQAVTGAKEIAGTALMCRGGPAAA